MRLKHLLSVFLTLLTLSVGQMWGASKTFAKITSTEDLESGKKYLIVHEGSALILDGSNVANGQEKQSVTISNGEITCDESYAFTITGSTGSWSITGSNSSTIGHTGSSNTLNTGNYTNTITFSGSNVVIGCNSRTLRYNPNTQNSNPLFRYYTSNQQAIQLYKEAAVATPYKVTFYKTDGTTTAITEASVGAGVTPPAMQSSCEDWEFQGWSTSSSNSQTSTTVLNTITLTNGKFYPTAATTLYPVYTKEGGSVEQYKLVNTLTNGKDYIFVTRNTDGSGYAFSSSITTGTSVTITTSGSDKIVSGTPANSIIWTAATGWSLTTKDNTKTNTKLKINGNTFALDATGSNNLAWTTDYGLNGKSSGSTKYYLQCNNNGTFSKPTSGSTTNRVWAYEKTGGSITYYYSYPNCCTALGQINGSISSTTPTNATVGWTIPLDNSSQKKAAGVILRLYNDNNGSKGTLKETVNTYASNNSTTSHTFSTDLTAGTKYWFTIELKGTTASGVTYCDSEEGNAVSFTTSKITAGTISGASTYVYGDANGGSVQTFTVSGKGLNGNLTVTAPSNFEVSTDDGSTWGSSKTITISSPYPKDLGNTTVKVRLAASLGVANNYGGDVEVSGGNAETVNVAVTGTVSPACENPDITTQTVADATYNLNATAAALTVTAQKHSELGDALTYQWLQCGTQDGTYVNAVGGSGATTSSYTPPTTTKGSNLYYKCEVSSGACSVYSNIAHIQVTTPTITVTESSPLAFGTKKVDGTYTATLHVSGATLAKDAGIAFEVGGTNAGMFSVISPELSPIAATSGTVGSTDITVQYAPTAKGSHSATLTFSSTGATPVVINLTGTGRYEDTYKTAMHTGITAWSSYTDGVTKAGDNYDVPNPGDISVNDREGSNCQGLHYHFAGWVTDANKEAGTISGNIIAATGTKDASNTTYWAVWEKETTAGSTNSITITRSTTGLSGNSYNSGNEKTWSQSEIDFGGHYIATNVANTPSGASVSQYIVMKKNDGTLYNTEELPGAITEVEIQQHSALSCNIYCGDDRLMASNNTSAGQTPSGTLITKPDDATTMTWTIAASNNYRFFALKAFTSSDNGVNYISSIKVTYTTVAYGDPKVVCEPCTATPSAGSVAVDDEGTFTTSQIDVKATSANAGTDCSYTDYGFVWSSSVSAAADLKLVEATGEAADNCTKVQAGTTGDATSFTGALEGSFSAGNSIYVRSYVKNENAGVSYQYGSVITITPRQVTFNMHGHGGNAPASQFVYSGGKVAAVDSPSEQGWTFDGWWDNDSYTGEAWEFATSTVSGANVTLHAKWTEKPKYTITLNAGNGTVSAAGWTQDGDVWKQEQEHGDAAITFPSANAGCAGWVFQGWKLGEAVTDASDFTADKNASDELVPTSNVTYYAVYRQNAVGGNDYTKITSTSEFTTGYYVITGFYNKSTHYRMGNALVEGGVSLTESSFNVENNTITQSEATFVWQIINFGSFAVFKNKDNGKYLAIVDGKFALLDDAQKFTYSVSNGAWTFTSPSGTQIVYTSRFEVGDHLDNAINLFKQGSGLTGNYYTNPSCDDLTVTGVADPAAGGTVLLSAASAKAGDKVYAYYEVDNAYKFDNWSVTGTGSAISSGYTTTQLTEVTIGSANTTITANFTAKAVATVKFYNNGVQVGTDQEVVEGNAPVAPTLTDGHVDAGGNACDANSTTHYGWTKTTWMNTLTKTQVDGKTGAEVVYAKRTTLPEIAAGDDGATIEYHAVWVKNAAEANTYKKGTSADLTAGQTVLIVNTSSSKALSSEESGNGYKAEYLTIDDVNDKTTTTNSNILWEVEVGTSGYFFKQGDNYINAGPYNTKHYLWFDTYSDEWTLTGSGPYVLHSTEDDGYQLEYYSSDDNFTTYTGTSGNAYNMDFYIPDVNYINFRTTCCEKRGITLSGVVNGEKEFSADLEEACEGETVTLAYTEGGHYNFSSWDVTYIDGESIEHSVSVNGENKFVMPAYAVTVEAYWSPKNYMVTIASAANGSATVVEGYAQQDGKWLVPYGSTVTLQAAPYDGEQYYFAGWTLSPDMDVDKTQATLAISMPGSFTATPSFAAVEYPALTLGTSANYTLSATLLNGDPVNMGSIRSGTDIKVTYSLIGQYEFDSWNFSQSITKNATDNYVTFKMPSTDLTVDLNAVAYYLLNLSVENGSVTVNGEAQEDASAQYRFHNGDDVEIAATPTNETYKFKEWTSDGFTEDNALTTDATGALFEMKTNNLTLHVAFEPKERYTLTFNALGRTHETFANQLEGTSIWSIVQQLTVAAPRLEGYEFLGWSLDENDKDMIVNGSNDMDLDDNYAMYAVYQKMKYKYALVESDLGSNWAGDYLIAYSSTIFADGRVGGTDGIGKQYTNANPDANLSGKIVAAEWGDTYNVTLEEILDNNGDGTNTYLMKTKDGKYNYHTNNSGNGLSATDNKSTAEGHPITINYNLSSDIELIVHNGAVFHYNPDQFFRFYKDGGQQNVYLYKKVGELDETVPAISIPTLNVTTEVNADDIYPDHKAGNIVVKDGGKLTAGSALAINNFTIEGTHGHSGQVMNAENLHINGDAYFDFTLGVDVSTPEGAAKAEAQWHNFSVPFPVNAISGVYGWRNNQWEQLTNEVDYAIEDYHGELRKNGEYGWKKFRGIMTPGHTYSMTVNGDIQTYRFKKAGDYTFDADPTVGFSQHAATGSGTSSDAGWNGLGNMRLCYSSISNDKIAETTPQDQAKGRYVLVLDAESYSYKPYALANINLTVGSAFFIQASGDGTMHFDDAQGGAGKIYAPARTQAKMAEPIMVTMSGERGSDHMYISADEDATSTYQIGRDMQRMFTTSNPTTPLIYTMNYGGLKLAAEDAPMVNDQAVYTLQLYAPIAGEYTLQTEAVTDADVYLTYEGAIIWNISESEYTVDLNKGKNNGYGLKLVKKAPSVVTGIDQIDAKAGVQKVIIDEHVYILRGGQMYDVNGKMVK